MTARSPIDPRSPKAFWDEQHRRVSEEPFAWVLKADQLISAFEVLVVDIETNVAKHSPPLISNVALMLAGFAIEDLLKARLIAMASPLDSKGRFAITSHNLTKLAADASFTLSHDDAHLLERLEEFLTWAGRYPVPLTSEPMRPRTLPGGSGFAPIAYHMLGKDFAAIRALIRRLKQDPIPKGKYAQVGI